MTRHGDRPPPPSPERDRALAAQPRHGPRKATSAGNLIAAWVKGAEAKRLERFASVAPVLAHVLGDQAQAVQPLSLQRGVLVLGVKSQVLMAELRNHAQAKLLAALAAAGAGVTALRWKVVR